MAVTDTRRDRDEASPPVATGVFADALRFLLDAGRAGSSLTRSMRARIGDPDLVTNLPIVVMTELYLHGPRRPVELLGVTGLTSGGMTKLLDRLQGAGLIVRSHGNVATDRRAIEVDLTARGRDVAETIATVVIERASDVAASFRRLADDATRLADDPTRSAVAPPDGGKSAHN